MKNKIIELEKYKLITKDEFENILKTLTIDEKINIEYVLKKLDEFREILKKNILENFSGNLEIKIGDKINTFWCQKPRIDIVNETITDIDWKKVEELSKKDNAFIGKNIWTVEIDGIHFYTSEKKPKIVINKREDMDIIKMEQSKWFVDNINNFTNTRIEKREKRTITQYKWTEKKI